jgi:hypothetical protein
MLADAATTIANAVSALRPDAATVLLVHRGIDELWRRTVDLLRSHGREVTGLELAEHNHDWRLPEVLGKGRVRLAGVTATADVLVYHDPLVSRGEPEDLTPLRRLVSAGTAAVFVSFPHALTPPLREHVRRIFLRALAVDERQLRARAERIRTRIEKLPLLTVVGPDGALLHASPQKVRDDWSSATLDVPVLQLPYGEVWAVCEPAGVSGTVAVARHAGRIEMADVDEGFLRWRRPAAGRPVSHPMVEIGLGVNPDAAWLAAVMLCEKHAGAAHIGFGDSTLIGGERVAPIHFDFALDTRSAIAEVGAMATARIEE